MILVVFLAAYLSENRSLLAEESTRLGPIRLPPIPYLAPMVAMWAIALGIVVVQRDLGAALLFFAVFLALLYVATGRLVLRRRRAASCSSPAPSSCTTCSATSSSASTTGWTRSADPPGAGFQTVQALYAFARGGLLGVGLGAGLPTIGGRLPIPAVHTDYPLAALGEELGLIGLLAMLGLYLVVVERGLRIAAAAHDDFRALLAAGLALVVGVQAFIIAAGNLKLIPLTGITLPFISYGGSSLLANAIVVGLLLALSDRGAEPPPPPRARRRLVAACGSGAHDDERQPRQRHLGRRQPRAAADSGQRGGHGRSAPTSPGPGWRSPARSPSSRSVRAGGRSPTPSACRPRRTTPRSSPWHGGRSAARSWTGRDPGSPAASATRTARPLRTYRDDRDQPGRRLRLPPVRDERTRARLQRPAPRPGRGGPARRPDRQVRPDAARPRWASSWRSTCASSGPR